MGSKMSFSRGINDQNTVSELSSVTTHPCNSIHGPSDSKQILQDKMCSEDELDFRWREGLEAKQLMETATESQPSAHLESDDVKSEAGNPDSQQRERTSSHQGMEAEHQKAHVSGCSSTIHGHVQPVEVRRKRGRPRKIKDAVQNEGVSLPKKKRGRPRKTENPAAVAFASANTISGINNTISGINNTISGISRSLSARRLRSRGEQKPSTEDGKSESKRELTPIDPIHTELCTAAIVQCVDQQVPKKVSRLDDSQEASSVLSNDTDCKERAVTDKQVELNPDKQETDTDGKQGQIAPQSREKKVKIRKRSLPRRKLRSQAAAASEGIPSQGLTSLNTVNLPQSEPLAKQSVDANSSETSQSKSSNDQSVNVSIQNTEPSCTGALKPTKKTRKAVRNPSTVKTENIEIELDVFKPRANNNNKLLQQSSNAKVKSGAPDCKPVFLRRKKGSKRRKRVSSVMLQKGELVIGHQGNVDTQKTDSCDKDKETSTDANTNASNTKKGGKKLLKCGYCTRTFKFLSQFVIHQRIHTGERPFKCLECGKGFSKNSNLNLHLKTHRKNTIYQKCPFCKLKFSCSEYPTHMKSHAHELDQVYENTKTAKRNRTNNQEVQALHTPVSSEKREKKECQYCGKTFPFQSALIRHVRVHTGEKPYKCDICGKAFGQAYFLRVHELTHWSVKRYNCTRCEKSFTHYSNAKNHTCRPIGSEEAPHPTRRIKPSLTYTCHICKNVFDQLQVFNSHMRDHTGAKLYRCLYCDKLFGVLSEFSAHRSECRGERNASDSAIKEEGTMSLIQYTVPALRCSSGPNVASPLMAPNSETVNKQLQSRRKKRLANLKKPFQSNVGPDHHLSHLVSKLNNLDNSSDPRKYVCPSCGRLFRHMGRLRAHMLTHPPGQSYTCTCCGKTLENWRKLWRHQRIHRQRRGRFTCPQCGQGFRFVEPYRKHMSEHPEFQWIPIRPKRVFLPYQCEQCRSSFKTLDLLFSHQVCHSSVADMHRDSGFDLSIDDQPNKKMLSPPTNEHIETLSSIEPEESVSTLPPLSKSLDSLSQESPLAPMISFVQNQSLDSGKTSLHPSSTHLIQDVETSQGRVKKNALGKPITPLRTVKRQMSQKKSNSNEASHGVICAVCGDAYSAISELYHHYLQHARGQV